MFNIVIRERTEEFLTASSYTDTAPAPLKWPLSTSTVFIPPCGVPRTTFTCVVGSS